MEWMMFVWKATGVDAYSITYFNRDWYTCGDWTQPIDVRFVKV